MAMNAGETNQTRKTRVTSWEERVTCLMKICPRCKNKVGIIHISRFTIDVYIFVEIVKSCHAVPMPVYFEVMIEILILPL
jgi:hypothetical protein